MPKTIWQPDRAISPDGPAKPSLFTALGRGLACKCPACGAAKLFNGYLKVVPNCASCAAPLGAARADDAPPYFTLFAVGHIVVPLLLWTDHAADLSVWATAAIFLPMTLVLVLALLRPIKGATVGVMEAFGMIPRETDG